MNSDLENFTRPVALRTVLELASKKLSRSKVYFGHGTDNPDDEAIQLVLYSLELPPECDLAQLDKLVSPSNANAAMDLIEQRINSRVPAAYLTGTAWFADLEFYADQRALVPRSPLAELVERSFAPWHNPDRIETVLDLCSGGGCIGIAAAHYLASAKVTLADISAPALELARKNIARHQVSARVDVIQADVFTSVGADHNWPVTSFDVIVSNPPYVDEKDFATMPAEYRVEPAIALQAGSDGLDLVRRILAQATSYLNDDGLLFVEVGNSAAALERAFPAVPFTWLEFSRGGHGVFLLRKDELEQYFPV